MQIGIDHGAHALHPVKGAQRLHIIGQIQEFVKEGHARAPCRVIVNGVDGLRVLKPVTKLCHMRAGDGVQQLGAALLKVTDYYIKLTAKPQLIFKGFILGTVVQKPRQPASLRGEAIAKRQALHLLHDGN